MKYRKLLQLYDFVFLYRNSIIGLGAGKWAILKWPPVEVIWLSMRVNSNIEELEKNTREKKLFDPVKAKAQIEVYKEIYNLEDPEEKDKMRLLKSASDDDKEKIIDFFKEKEEPTPEE